MIPYLPVYLFTTHPQWFPHNFCVVGSILLGFPRDKNVTLEAAIAIIEELYSEVADSKLDIANESPVGWLIYSCTSEPDNSQLGRSDRL